MGERLISNHITFFIPLKILQVSISSTFYTHIFCTKAKFSTYVWLCNFLVPKFQVRKTLMKLKADFPLDLCTEEAQEKIAFKRSIIMTKTFSRANIQVYLRICVILLTRHFKKFSFDSFGYLYFLSFQECNKNVYSNQP